MSPRAAVALFALCACGGAPGPAGARKPAVSAPAPLPPAPAGWSVVDEPTFLAHMPTGFQTKEEPGGGRAFVGTKDDVAYTLTHRELEPELEWQPEKAFDRATEAFFRRCRGARVRLQRADTLEHKTLTVDGTCEVDKPALGQVHIRGRDLYELYIVLTGSRWDIEEPRGFFRAFRVKSS